MSKKMIVNESNIHEITEKVRKLFTYREYIDVNDYLTKLCAPYMYCLEKYYTIEGKKCFFTCGCNLTDVELVFHVEESEFHVNDLVKIRQYWQVDDVYVRVREEEFTVNVKDSPLSINIPDYTMELVVLIKVELPPDNTSWSIQKRYIDDALSFADELNDLELEIGF